MTTRILLAATASPKRICHQAEQIFNAGAYPEPEIAVLCRESERADFQKLPGVTVYCVADHGRQHAPEELRQKKFDVVFAFWTGEKTYRWLKLLALRLKAKETRIIGGDGNEFRLTRKALCRHAVFRWRHPLPTDHCDFIQLQGAAEVAGLHPYGDRVLIVQSAEPFYVRQALDRLKEKPLFRNPRYTIFCRNRPEAVESFHAHPMLDEVLTHTETRGSWKHLRNLRRRRFDAIVLFMTGDPGYRKIKFFAFLLGARLSHVLIFNEAADCFFFNCSQWLALVLHRLREQPHLEASSRWSDSARILVSWTIKSALLPFRFFWLLFVWLRLRIAGLKSSGKGHDYSLRLPLLPGP